MLDLSIYYSWNKLLLILINVIGVWLGFWVYFSNRREKQNQLFFLLTVFLLFWINGGYFFNLSKSINGALFLGRIILGEVFLSLVVIYFFLLYFPQKREKTPKFYKKIILGSTIMFVLVAFSDLVVKSVELTTWGVNPIYNPFGKYFFYGAIVILAFLILKELLQKYLALSEKERLRVQYFLIGLFIFIIANLIFNVALPMWQNSIRYWQLGNYSAIFLLTFTAYAIVKRNLFGIKIVLTALLVGLIAFSMLIDIFFLTPDLLTKLFKTLLLVIFLYFGYLLIKGVVREIQYRERLQKAYRDLKGLDEAKSEFLSITSHQLRTPLSAMKGYISMILEGSYGKLPERARQSIENVYQSNERLIKLVNDILNVSRIEAGRIEIKFQKVSLEEIINSVIKELKHQAERKNIYLKFEKPSKPLPRVTVDEDKIRHVILNIVDNAIRYTNKGGITVQAEVKNSSKIIIIVKDTGLGMTGKEISELFKSFSRGIAGNRLYTGGAGLGLYIAKKFVDIHGGKISAESKGIGKGSTFYVEIPIFEQSEKTRF